MRRTPLRRVSAKRAALNRVRRAVLAALAARPGGEICARCQAARAVDGHELLRRSGGGSITDPDNIVLLCRACHDWIGAHPAAAAATGWEIRHGPPPESAGATR